jgi:hypothetical protein
MPAGTGTGGGEGTGAETGTEEGLGIFGPSYAVTLRALAQYAVQLREAGALNVIWSD